MVCALGDTEVISLFKDCEEKYLNAKDNKGNTAFDYAQTYNKGSLLPLVNSFGKRTEKIGRNHLNLIKEALDRRDLMLVNALFTFGRPFGIAQEEADYLNILPSNLLAQLLLMYDLSKPQEQKISISDLRTII